MRLLARVYAEGDKPSKVDSGISFIRLGDVSTNIGIVVAKLHEAEVHGKISLILFFRYKHDWPKSLYEL